MPHLHERQQKLRENIERLQLLIEQVRAEILTVRDRLPNKVIKKTLELQNAQKDLSDAIKKLEDMRLQLENEPLIIKEGKCENKA